MIVNNNTKGLFIQRFNRLLNRTGMLVINGKYKTHGFENINKDIVTETMTSYIDVSTYDIYVHANGINIPYNQDSTLRIEYGIKVKFTPTSLVIEEKLFYHKFRLKTIIQPTNDFKKGKESNSFSDAVSKMYYDQLMNEEF